MAGIGIGVIGYGFIGGVHANAVKLVPGAYLAGIATRNEAKKTEIAEKFGCKYYRDYHEMLKDKDIHAVSICLPSGMHSSVCIEAAKAGKHVICEKPIDIEIDRAHGMIDVCKENNVKLAVIMQHRFDKPMLLLQKAAEDGRMGKIIWGASRTIWYRDDEYFAIPGHGTWESDGGGALLIQGIHYIDLLQCILGEVKSVSGKCRTLLHKQIETEDVGIANIEFKNGALGTIEGTTTSYPGLYAELCIFGENGSVIIRNDHLAFYRFKGGADAEFEELLNPVLANELNTSKDVDDTSHRLQIADFVDSIKNNRQPKVTGEDALNNLKLIKAVYESSKTGKEVFL